MRNVLIPGWSRAVAYPENPEQLLAAKGGCYVTVTDTNGNTASAWVSPCCITVGDITIGNS
jgi:hypothetical protein